MFVLCLDVTLLSVTRLESIPAGLKLWILLPQPSKSWGYRHNPPLCFICFLLMLDICLSVLKQ